MLSALGEPGGIGSPRAPSPESPIDLRVTEERGRGREDWREDWREDTREVIGCGGRSLGRIMVSTASSTAPFAVDRGLCTPNFLGAMGARGRNLSGRLSSTGRAEFGRCLYREVAPAVSEDLACSTLSGSMQRGSSARSDALAKGRGALRRSPPPVLKVERLTELHTESPAQQRPLSSPPRVCCSTASSVYLICRFHNWAVTVAMGA